jgi:hypothetical protein
MARAFPTSARSPWARAESPACAADRRQRDDQVRRAHRRRRAALHPKFLIFIRQAKLARPSPGVQERENVALSSARGLLVPAGLRKGPVRLEQRDGHPERQALQKHFRSTFMAPPLRDGIPPKARETIPCYALPSLF